MSIGCVGHCFTSSVCCVTLVCCAVSLSSSWVTHISWICSVGCVCHGFSSSHTWISSYVCSSNVLIGCSGSVCNLFTSSCVSSSWSVVAGCDWPGCISDGLSSSWDIWALNIVWLGWNIADIGSLVSLSTGDIGLSWDLAWRLVISSVGGDLSLEGLLGIMDNLPR